MLEAKHAIATRERSWSKMSLYHLEHIMIGNPFMTNEHIYTSWLSQETFLSDRFISEPEIHYIQYKKGPLLSNDQQILALLHPCNVFFCT